MGASEGVVEYVDSGHEEHYNPDVPGGTDMGATPTSPSNNEQGKELRRDGRRKIQSGRAE